MYIAILNKTIGGHRSQEILGLYRELDNALDLIRRLANLMVEQWDDLYIDEDESNENCIIVKDGPYGEEMLRYWILEKEVFEDE